MTTLTSQLEPTNNWTGEVYHQHSEQQWMVADCLLKQFVFKETDHVLDVGCGDGKITYRIAQSVPKGKVVGFDPSQSMLQCAKQRYEKQNVHFELGKASEVAFFQEFDVITSFSALHWEPKQKEALFAFKRALKEGGSILLAVPGPDFTLRSAIKHVCESPSWAPFFTNFQSPGRVWQVNEYVQLLLEVGFEIQKVEWVESRYVFDDEEKYTLFLDAMLPHTAKIPLELRAQFLNEIVSFLKNRNTFNANGSINFDIRVIEVIASKPTNTKKTLVTDAKDDPAENWQKIKEDFQLDPNCVHLGLGMLTSHPKIVRESIEKHRAGLDRNPTLYYRNKDYLEKKALESAARYLETTPSQIALTESTTMGLAVVISGIKMSPGEEILVTEHEHYAVQETLRYKEKRENILIKRISLYENARYVSCDQIIERVIAGITDKTRVVILTWVHSSTGVKLPIQKIAQEIAKTNASRSLKNEILLVVDGLHGFGVENLKVEELGCDFFVAGCHKWVFGPRGTGIVWGKDKGWDRLIPIMPSFAKEAFFAWFQSEDPDHKCPSAGLFSPGGFQAYEHRWALGEAFEFLLLIGKQKIADRVHALNSYCKGQLEKIPRLQLHTPTAPDLFSGMICFEIEGMAPHEVIEKLIAKGILCGQTPYRQSFCRFTPGILNTMAEIDQAVVAVKEIIGIS